MTPLVLRDVHEGTSPEWWPLAPGWWLLLGAILVITAFVAWRVAVKRRRRIAIVHLFDDAVARAGTPSQQIAAMSELLRRAARRKDVAADTLEGEDWLRCLDAGMPQPVFSAGVGKLLSDGGFRADIAAHESDAVRVIARERYLSWMQGA